MANLIMNKQIKGVAAEAMPARMGIWRRSLWRVVGMIALTLAAAAAGVYLWANLSLDSSLAARGVIWGTARADDWQRYPSRALQASPRPRYFQPADEEYLAGLTVDNVPLDSWLEANQTTALVMLHGDELVYEAYFNGSGREATQASLSVAKSFASTLLGMAIEEGFIHSLDDPITRYLPELLDRDPRFAQITLRHLVTMSSGLRFTGQDPDRLFSDDFITYSSPDLRAAALETVILEPPGQTFWYNDYNPILLGMALERATGMSVAQYMETRLWQPMGAEGDGSWDMDSRQAGMEKMSVGVNGRALDLVKLGWLFLNEGRVGEQQLVPAGWVAEATRADIGQDPAAHYQYFWWVDAERGAYYAEGNFCQYIYVYPAADLVIARFGSSCGGSYSVQFLGDLAVEVARRIDAAE